MGASEQVLDLGALQQWHATSRFFADDIVSRDSMGTEPPASVFGRYEGRFEKIETPALNTAVPADDRLIEWESQLYDIGYAVIPEALPASAVEHFRERRKNWDRRRWCPVAIAPVGCRGATTAIRHSGKGRARCP